MPPFSEFKWFMKTCIFKACLRTNTIFKRLSKNLLPYVAQSVHPQCSRTIWFMIDQGGRRHWYVNYTGTQIGMWIIQVPKVLQTRSLFVDFQTLVSWLVLSSRVQQFSQKFILQKGLFCWSSLGVVINLWSSIVLSLKIPECLWLMYWQYWYTNTNHLIRTFDLSIYLWVGSAATLWLWACMYVYLI